jgi:hypothetical protein
LISPAPKVTGVHVDPYVVLGRYLGLDVEPHKGYEQFQMLVERFLETVAAQP